MMYSQQEYDMVRRQTMQIEAEKRVLLRWALIAVTALLVASLLLTGWMYHRYSTSDNLISNAQAKAVEFENKYQQVSRELAEKNAILEQNVASRAKENMIIESTLPKMLNRTAPDNEIAELARAIYQQPGHMIELPGPPPDEVLGYKGYRLRIDDRPHKYQFVAGLLNDRWVIYSVLTKNQEDRR